MHCDEFESRLNELLDARRPPEQDLALAAHADECAACHPRLAAQRAWRGCLDENVRPEPAADFTSRVLNGARPRPLERQQSWKQRALLAVAAAVLLAFGARWLSNVPWGGATANSPTPRAGAPSASAGHPAKISPQRNVTPFNDAQQPSYAAAAEETRQAVSAALSLLPTTESLGTAEAESSGGVQTSWSSEMADCMEPLADSTGAAVDFLLSVLPEGIEPPPTPADAATPNDGA